MVADFSEVAGFSAGMVAGDVQGALTMHDFGRIWRVLGHLDLTTHQLFEMGSALGVESVKSPLGVKEDLKQMIMDWLMEGHLTGPPSLDSLVEALLSAGVNRMGKYLVWWDTLCVCEDLKYIVSSVSYMIKKCWWGGETFCIHFFWPHPFIPFT